MERTAVLLFCCSLLFAWFNKIWMSQFFVVLLILFPFCYLEKNPSNKNRNHSSLQRMQTKMKETETKKRTSISLISCYNKLIQATLITLIEKSITTANNNTYWSLRFTMFIVYRMFRAFVEYCICSFRKYEHIAMRPPCNKYFHPDVYRRDFPPIEPTGKYGIELFIIYIMYIHIFHTKIK